MEENLIAARGVYYIYILQLAEPLRNMIHLIRLSKYDIKFISDFGRSV